MNKCFAYDKKGCRALKIRECKDCNFYKTKEEADEAREKALNRIMNLDEEIRRNIIDTYYNGKIE